MKDPIDLGQLEDVDDEQLEFLEQILKRELDGMSEAQERLRMAIAAIRLQRQGRGRKKRR